MKRKFAVLTAILAIAVTSALAGMDNPVVGGPAMYPTKNIIRKRGELRRSHYSCGCGEGGRIG